ncbi:MAG: Hpt domain-containing protein [Clostridiaceae bacterium]|nr:Hpt domain-containing protein [Clostridiaceae bacterium]
MDEKAFRYNIQDLADDMEVGLETLSSLYSEFFHEMKINIQESKALANNKDWDKLQRVIHNIKGISTCLNVNDIYFVSQQLDTDLKNQKFENVLSNINSINELFNCTETDIREFFKNSGITI